MLFFCARRAICKVSRKNKFMKYLNNFSSLIVKFLLAWKMCNGMLISNSTCKLKKKYIDKSCDKLILKCHKFPNKYFSDFILFPFFSWFYQLPTQNISQHQIVIFVLYEINNPCPHCSSAVATECRWCYDSRPICRIFTVEINHWAGDWLGKMCFNQFSNSFCSFLCIVPFPPFVVVCELQSSKVKWMKYFEIKNELAKSKHFIYHSIKVNCWKIFFFYFQQTSFRYLAGSENQLHFIVFRVKFLFFFASRRVRSFTLFQLYLTLYTWTMNHSWIYDQFLQSCLL